MFERIIGYDTEKQEIAKFCDIIKNPDYYKTLNISIPKGIILHGKPGVGKTTFANSIIEYCGRPTFTIRKNASTTEFIKHMRDTFEEAKKAAPSIVLLDDMDKFGSGEVFSQEYTSLQGILDDYRNYDIFVLGTANELFKLPASLTRAGRFDRIFSIDIPTAQEASLITAYYLSDKNIDPSVNIDTLSAILKGYSCATLESVVNIAAMNAAYDRSMTIKMTHLLEAIFTIVYDMPKISSRRTQEESYMRAIHEAGHVVVSEIITPGAISFSTIRESKLNTRANITSINLNDVRSYISTSMILLAGNIAFEIKFNRPDMQDPDEVSSAKEWVSDIISTGINGYDKVRTYDMYSEFGPTGTSEMNTSSASYMDILRDNVRQILISNWNFVEAIANALLQNETLIKDDIQYIKDHLIWNNVKFNTLIRNN